MLSFLKNKYTLAYAMLQPFSTAFDVGAAYVLMVAIDFAASGSLEKWALYLTGFLSYIILQFCTDLLTKRVQEKALATALQSLRKQLMAKILGMSTQTYSQKNSGAYLAYITKNTEKIDSLFFRKLFDFYPQLLQFAASVCLLFALDWRLAIARALIKNTPIILLDESTAALDNETATDIENMLLSDTDKTCIIISHHVSDSLKAKVDRIISMESL